MGLKHIYINNYKNLKNLNLDFNGDYFIDVLVRKTAIGRSNIF